MNEESENGEELYVGYAQKVPEGAKTYDEIDFAILFLVRKDAMYGF